MSDDHAICTFIRLSSLIVSASQKKRLNKLLILQHSLYMTVPILTNPRVSKAILTSPKLSLAVYSHNLLEEHV